MANLKELRTRITSVGSTMQITSAMKMVSAAKLKKAQDAITQMRPYADKLQDILVNISATLDPTEGAYGEQRDVKKVLLIVITSNKGLCGAFNTNVIKQAKRLADNYTKQGVSVSILAIGKKGRDTLKKDGYQVDADHIDIFKELRPEEVGAIALGVMEQFLNREVDRVDMVYNQFKNAASQNLMTEQFLPIKPVENVDASNLGDYIYEPGQKEILETLIPQTLKTQLLKGMLDSFASEHGARMTTMHKATDNAKEIRDDLKLEYNKARQAAITNEILEIVGGADALG
ncbi:MAG: ATP synthase F1 subunit gamma [Schleiferiaceae bacterium]|nr:ATP synthase F1 subunit gamma [Schleiferiaceae bacterium]